MPNAESPEQNVRNDPVTSSGKNISKDDEPVKYSIGNNDNSSESLTRKINSKTYTVKGRGLK